MVDPARTRATYGEHDTLRGVHEDDEVVNGEPFEVFDLQLSVLWADVEQVR